ncbi:unnamed protein product [Prorocentrum cordatum]|uniref:Uncharacterized protein n=1 Tax=Prorocentrum cordatum TaxID=2364126 RepID=A0ABN9QTE2_9DINO|nr:unnamed protein product [Polarella glacialis]
MPATHPAATQPWSTSNSSCTTWFSWAPRLMSDPGAERPSAPMAAAMLPLLQKSSADARPFMKTLLADSTSEGGLHVPARSSLLSGRRRRRFGRPVPLPPGWAGRPPGAAGTTGRSGRGPPDKAPSITALKFASTSLPKESVAASAVWSWASSFDSFTH